MLTFGNLSSHMPKLEQAGYIEVIKDYVDRRLHTMPRMTRRARMDDVCSKAGVIEAVRANIVEHADACGTLMGLIHSNKVDVVFGWNAFKNVWPDTCDTVELPRDIQVFRSTAAQVVSYTRDEALSRKLIDFLTSTEGRGIYEEHGWLHEPR